MSAGFMLVDLIHRSHSDRFSFFFPPRKTQALEDHAAAVNAERLRSWTEMRTASLEAKEKRAAERIAKSQQAAARKALREQQSKPQ
jgi:hypothetical protein